MYVLLFFFSFPFFMLFVVKLSGGVRPIDFEKRNTDAAVASVYFNLLLKKKKNIKCTLKTLFTGRFLAPGFFFTLFQCGFKKNLFLS
jgi:hypothetical protein